MGYVMCYVLCVMCLYEWIQWANFRASILNGPFAAEQSGGTKSPYWRANDALGHVKQSHQIWIFFVEHVPVRHLLSSMAILYHVIAQLQKTLLNFYVDLQLCKVKAILELNKHWRNKSVSLFFLFH